MTLVERIQAGMTTKADAGLVYQLIEEARFVVENDNAAHAGLDHALWQIEVEDSAQ